MSKILTTHVGSLPRTQEVVDFIFAREHGESYDSKAFDAANIKPAVEQFISDHELSFGAVLPILRIATSGTMKGPDVFKSLELIGQQATVERLKEGYIRFDAIKAAQAQS